MTGVSRTRRGPGGCGLSSAGDGLGAAGLQDPASLTLEQALEMEAQAQALCMGTADFRRAYEAFAAKQTPTFEGN